MNDGGPAFPQIHTNHGFKTVHAQDGSHRDVTGLASDTYSIGGMSLRDYFAAAALCGIRGQSDQDNAGMDYEHFAKTAWKQADAMIAERNKSQ
jgi:hypothetical protein